MIEKLRLPWSTGLKSLFGEFCLYPSVFPMPSETLVPVRKPCCTPKFAFLNDVTRKLVPVVNVLVSGLRLVLELRVDEERGVQIRNGRSGELHVQSR